MHLSDLSAAPAPCSVCGATHGPLRCPEGPDFGGSPRSLPWFTLDGIVVTLDELRRDNPDLDLAAAERLEPGEELDLGGGAFATFTLRRTA